MSLLDTASLIVTPNGYKEGKLYSVIPSDGSGDLSVTRATTATRVNSQGLVELVPYNLVQYSETFASPWGALSGASVSANSAVSPNGQNTAATFSVTSTAFSGFIQTLGSSAQNISIYAKKGTLDYLWIVNESISAIGASYNLATGVVTYTASGHTATIESVGNGWYRCTISHPTNGWEYMQFGLSNASNSGSSPSGGNAYIWGAQAVEGSVAKDYQKTETRLNIPRLDYSNGTCPSILVEPQRTNLVTYSSSFDNAAWQKENSSVTANTTTSPDGTQNADSLIENGSYDSHLIYQGGTLSAASYSASVFIKKNTRQYAFLQIATDGAANRYTIVVDLNNGTMTASSTSGSPSGTSYKIDSMGDGWYRLSVTATHTSAQVYSVFGLSNSGTPTFNSVAIPIYSGNGTSGAYIYGAQLEAGSYATSYIPTTSASVTRNADVISKTGISSLIGQTEGVWYLDLFASAKNGDGVSYATWLIAGDATNNFQIYNLGTTLYWYAKNAGGVLIDQTANETLVEGQRYKIAFAYKGGDYALYINGVQKRTSTNANVPTVSQFNLSAAGYGASAAIVKNEYNAIALWKTRLTNAQLATLTTI